MNAPGENLLIKMWDSLVDRGIGGLLAPWQKRRLGRADIDLKIAELRALGSPARVDLTDFSVQNTRGLGVEPSVEPSQLAALALDVATSDAIRRETNTARAILFAENELIGDDSVVPEARPDEDWLYRWKEGAAAVSSEKLASLWGKVLAGETKRPGSYSLRTLEFIKTLSREEANAIDELSKFAMAGHIFMEDRPLLDAAGITHPFLLGMEALGIVVGVSSVQAINYEASSDPAFKTNVCARDRIILMNGPGKGVKFPMRVCMITDLGLELFELSARSVHEPYFFSLAKRFRDQSGFTVSTGDYRRVSENEGEAQRIVPLP